MIAPVVWLVVVLAVAVIVGIARIIRRVVRHEDEQAEVIFPRYLWDPSVPKPTTYDDDVLGEVEIPEAAR